MTNCKLIFKPEPDCNGLVTKRSIGPDLSIICCEKHYIVYKQIEFLVESGYDISMVKQFDQAKMILAIDKIEREQDNGSIK